jgi:predicted RNase H-like HicB family nuclease
MKLRVVVRKIEDGLYIASCPELEGCHVEAETEPKAKALLKTAITAYIASHKQRHEKIQLKSNI